MLISISAFNLVHNPVVHPSRLLFRLEKLGYSHLNYVCTTELLDCPEPLDIFYHGMDYIGIKCASNDEITDIFTADDIVNYNFRAIVGDDGNYYYSRSKDETIKFDNDVYVKGGRFDPKSSSDYVIFEFIKGRLVPTNKD